MSESQIKNSNLGAMGARDASQVPDRRSRRRLVLGCVLAIVCAGLAVTAYQRWSPVTTRTVIVQSCSEKSGVFGAEVEFVEIKTGDDVRYSVQAVRARDGSRSAAGWLLHHRPEDSADRFEPESVFSGDELIGQVFSRQGISTVPMLGKEKRMTVTSVTCPGGECLFSPLTGCKPTYNNEMTGPKVALVGDSLLAWDEACGATEWPAHPDYCPLSLMERLQLRGARVFSQSSGGQGFYSWLPVIREQATTQPDVFVLALGTNDAWVRQALAPPPERPTRRSQTLQSLRAALRDIRSSSANTCVILVTASEKLIDPKLGLYEPPEYPAEARFVNAALRRAATDKRHGLRIYLADFAAAAREHCGAAWPDDVKVACDWFQADQLHLSGPGDRARNELVLEAIARCGTAGIRN